MKATMRHVSVIILTWFMLAACGRSTVTASLLNANQTVEQTVEVTTVKDSEPHNGDQYFSKVTLETSQPALISQHNIEKYSGRSLKNLPAIVEAERLLTSYAERVAHTFSDRDGPNCWHTSVASLFQDYTRSRYMDSGEFSCHVKTFFSETNSPTYGDMIRFVDQYGNEVHGATVIGMDKLTDEMVVFTKNGYSKSEPWTFMTLADLKKVYPEATSVKFYAPQRKAIEPVSEKADCHDEYLESIRIDGNTSMTSVKTPQFPTTHPLPISRY